MFTFLKKNQRHVYYFCARKGNFVMIEYSTGTFDATIDVQCSIAPGASSSSFHLPKRNLLRWLIPFTNLSQLPFRLSPDLPTSSRRSELQSSMGTHCTQAHSHNRTLARMRALSMKRSMIYTDLLGMHYERKTMLLYSEAAMSLLLLINWNSFWSNWLKQNTSGAKQNNNSGSWS